MALIFLNTVLSKKQKFSLCFIKMQKFWMMRSLLVCLLDILLLIVGEWIEINCSNRPPPTGAFTFTKIDPDHALLFGGRVEHTRMNHVFILDMISMVCGIM